MTVILAPRLSPARGPRGAGGFRTPLQEGSVHTFHDGSQRQPSLYSQMIALPSPAIPDAP
jgi:hypothetical protein